MIGSAQYMDELRDIQTHVLDMADVIACAIIKRQQPAADLMTKNAAYKFAGRGWIDNHISAKRLVAVSSGSEKNSPVMLSRTEIVALQESERIVKRHVMKYKPRQRKEII